MRLTLTITNEEVKSTEVITNTDGDRGLQILFVAGALGDDNNRAAVSIVAIDGPTEEAASEYFRFEGIEPETTTLLIFYPGIEPLDEVNSKATSAVLPYKFQIAVSNVMGLPATFQIYAATLP